MSIIFRLSAFLCLFLTVMGDQCVTYNFEEGLEEFFANTRSCNSFPLWNPGYYNSTSVTPPHENSATFLKPNPTSSCVSSTPFMLDLEGTLEVNVFMDSVDLTDHLMVLVQVVNTGGADIVVAQGGLESTDGTLVSTNGFQTIYIESTGFPLFGENEAYLVFVGTAAEGSTVIIDSYRYVPPDFEKDVCPIYEDYEPTTTVSTTVFTTIEETTPIITTIKTTTIVETTEQSTTEIDIEGVITLPTEVLPTITEDGSEVTVTVTESTQSTTLESDEILPTEEITTITEDNTVVTTTLSTIFSTLETDSETSTLPNTDVDVTTDNFSDATILSTTNIDGVATEPITSTTLDLDEETNVDNGVGETIASTTGLSTVDISTIEGLTTTTEYNTETTAEVSVTEEFMSSTNIVTEVNTIETVTSIEESNEITVTESTIYTTEENESTVSTIHVNSTETESSTTDIIDGDTTTATSNPSTLDPDLDENTTIHPNTEDGNYNSTVTVSTILISTNDNINTNMTVTEETSTTEYLTEETIGTTEAENIYTVTDIYTTANGEDEPIFTDSTIRETISEETTETIDNSEYTTESMVVTTDSYTATDENDSDGLTNENGIESTTPISTDSTNSTEQPVEIYPERRFWNPLAIATVVALSCIVLTLTFWCFYACGRRNANKTPHFLLVDDYDSLPRPIVVPRPKSYATTFNNDWFKKNYV